MADALRYVVGQWSRLGPKIKGGIPTIGTLISNRWIVVESQAAAVHSRAPKELRERRHRAAAALEAIGIDPKALA